jgi:hypothetical protein
MDVDVPVPTKGYQPSYAQINAVVEGLIEVSRKSHLRPKQRKKG